MTNPEFKLWYRDYCAAFPGTAEFVAKGTNGGQATLEFWFKVLAPYDLDVANTATMLMLAGKEEQVDIKDRAKIPSHVATLCQKLIDRSKHANAVAGLRKPLDAAVGDEEPAQWNTAAITRRLIECAASGGDVEALSKRLMPIDPEKEPRYRCLHCRDRGRLSVWHPATMKLAERGKAVVSGRGLYSMCITCKCRAGDLYKREGEAVFDPDRWLPCRGLPYRQADLDELTQFVLNIKPANYVQEFADWNDRAEV